MGVLGTSTRSIPVTVINVFLGFAWGEIDNNVIPLPPSFLRQTLVWVVVGSPVKHDGGGIVQHTVRYKHASMVRL